MSQPAALATIGRYVLHDAIAHGGMATVHAARYIAAESVARLVAAKRLHPQFTCDPEFVAMFHDEARIASRIHHPNVVPVLDVIVEDEELILVQEYVHGVPLSHLLKRAAAKSAPIPMPIIVAIVTGMLAGLHAAHEVTDDLGEPLGVVHRDVSPQNVLVSVDGVPRLVDFGIAKAKTSESHTRAGVLKGKLAYMAPEQFRSEAVTRRADIYATGVLLWELIVNRRFYDGSNDVEFVRAVALGEAPTPTQALAEERASLSDRRWADVLSLEAIVMRATSADPEERYPTAAAMAAALLATSPSATASEVADWVRFEARDYLEKRQQLLATNDESWRAAQSGTVATVETGSGREGGWRSGARMKVTGGTDSHHPLIASVSPTVAVATVPAAMRSRSVLPWAVVGGLLVVVGLLGGFVLRLDAARDMERPPVPMAAAAQPSTAVPTIAIPTSPTPEPSLPPEPSPTSPAPAPVRVIAPVRPAPPPPPLRIAPTFQRAPVASPPSASAPSASIRPDCSPPFYFEGNKKVFKPSCL
jgi:serine/threonine-protein kinase